MSLADHMPESLKEGFAKRNLEVGAVIKVFVEETKPPKEKRLIIVGASYEKLYFAMIFINSEINPTVFGDERTQALHLKIFAKDCEFLDYDSYVDCSRLHSMSIEQMLAFIDAEPTRHLGVITRQNFQQIKLLIKSAHTVNTAEKKRFELFLNI